MFYAHFVESVNQMCQEDVRRLLVALGGEASLTELSNLAREQYPNRSLHAYLGDRLKAMERKGIVEKPDAKASIWRLTESGSKNKIGDFSLDEIDDVVTEHDLEEEGIKIVNIVGSPELDSRLVLENLAKQIPNTEYIPETSPSLIFRDENGVTVLVHSTGRVSIAGAKGKDKLISGTENFLDVIQEVRPEVKKSAQDLSIDNIVANSELSRELDLAEVAITLDLENVEYEPEQFPGLIYRSEINPTILIFNSGKCVIAGAKTFTQILDSYYEVAGELADIGVVL